MHLRDAELEKSWTICVTAHSAVGQLRKYTGEPYYYHPKAVGDILMGEGFPLTVIQAAYLHDVIEDTHMTYEGIIHLLPLTGREVAQLVREVTKVSVPSDGNRAIRKQMDAEHYARGSFYGQSIKVADVFHNTKDIVEQNSKFASVLLPEALKLLGMLDKAHAGLRAAAVAQCLRGLRELGVGNGID